MSVQFWAQIKALTGEVEALKRAYATLIDHVASMEDRINRLEGAPPEPEAVPAESNAVAQPRRGRPKKGDK